MSLKQLAVLPALIFFLALAGMTSAQTPPSMEKDPLGYLRYLQTSPDPQAVAVRTQIENGPADLAKARAAAITDGLALDTASLQRPLPPEGQNAAPVYAKLAQTLKDHPLGLPIYAQPLGASHTYTPEQLAGVQKIYDSRPEVWTLVHQAADAPQCVVTRDWKLGPALMFPDLATYREAERLLYTETYLLAAQGKYSDAVKNQARGFRIAGHAASDPILLSYLVGEACEAIALRGMQDILALCGPNAEVAKQMKQTVEANRPALFLRVVMQGETAYEAVNFDWMHGSHTANSLGQIAAASAADKQFASKWLDASEALVLMRMRTLTAASDLPLAGRRRAFAPMIPAPPAVLSGLLPDYVQIADHPARLAARETVTLAAAAVMGAWTEDGTFPAALPGTFTDPFTGKPLGYRREGEDGFVVYCAGPDGKFDGGKPGEKTPPGLSLMVFRYPVFTTPAGG